MKTKLAHAIAKEKGWSIVELNASEQRNAAAIRSSATRGSQYVSLETFSAGSETTGKTVILLDEVDHLSGGFSQVSEERIHTTMGSEEGPVLKGDSGGKAELLNLLKKTENPVIMTCNDPMKLWGRGNWRRKCSSCCDEYWNRGEFRYTSHGSKFGRWFNSNWN